MAQKKATRLAQKKAQQRATKKKKVTKKVVAKVTKKTTKANGRHQRIKNAKAGPKRKLSKEGFTVLTSERIPFTQEKAAELEFMEEFIGERPLRDTHCIYLAEEMEKGTFLWHEASLAVAYCVWDNCYRRANGHHTCVAYGLFDKMRTLPEILLTVYKVRTEEEFRRLYSKFDRIAPRTRVHVGNIRLLNTPEFAGVTETTLKKVLQGFNSWQNNKVPIDESADRLLGVDNALAHKVIPSIKAVLGNKQSSFLNRAPVHGAMFVTYGKALQDSQDFWDAVISGLNFSSTHDPAKVLRDWIITYVIKKSTAANKAVVTHEMILRACILAFNKFRKGEKMHVIKVSQTTRRPKAV